MTKSEQVNELFAALSKAQGEIDSATKDSPNPFFKSTYADLNSVWNACRAALSKNNLCVLQTTDQSEKGIVRTTTILGHSSGQWISSSLDIPITKVDAQSIGSAITYARRYTLAALVGVTQQGEDDDGNAAVGIKTERPTPQQAPVASQKIQPKPQQNFNAFKGVK